MNLGYTMRAASLLRLYSTSTSRMGGVTKLIHINPKTVTVRCANIESRSNGQAELPAPLHCIRDARAAAIVNEVCAWHVSIEPA